MSSYGIFFMLGLADVDIPAIFECIAHIVHFKSSCAAHIVDLYDKT